MSSPTVETIADTAEIVAEGSSAVSPRVVVAVVATTVVVAASVVAYKRLQDWKSKKALTIELHEVNEELPTA